jgi:hypothetical protein
LTNSTSSRDIAPQYLAATGAEVLETPT